MDSVDILDRVNIVIMETKPGHFNVDFLCKEKGKQLTFDTKAKETLTGKLNELLIGKPINPTTRGYIEEFCGRLIKEYHKQDLVVIEDVPEGPADEYAAFRNIH